MIDHIWTVVCKRAVIDARREDLFLQSIIESIIILTEPKPDGLLSVPLTIVSYWCRTDPALPALHRFRFIFGSPSKTIEIFTDEIDLVNDVRHRYILEITTLPVSEPGRHYFYTELETEPGEWKRVAGVPIDIEFHPELREKEMK